MAESAVLFHSHSFAAPLSRTDSYEDNTNHALSQSVSFGRFMTENLEWGKWSSFSHRKYVDEAEKFSQPGSVAQKKAFFEAHYKKIAEAKKAKEDESSNPKEEDEPESVAVLLNTLETLTKNDDVKEEERDEIELVVVLEQEENLLARPVTADDLEAVLEVLDEMEKEENSFVGEKEEERSSVSKNLSVFRPSMEKSMELVLSEKPVANSSMKKNEKPVHPKFSFLNFFIGNTKTQDQNSTRKKDKKPKKQFLCLCFKPEMVGETEVSTKTQRRSL